MKKELSKIADDIQKIIEESKATFFVCRNQQEPKISSNELLYELKAEISNNISMYFYKRLKKKNEN